MTNKQHDELKTNTKTCFRANIKATQTCLKKHTTPLPSGKLPNHLCYICPF